MQRFFDFAAVLGILVKGTKENISPKDLQKVLEQVENKPEEVVINTMLLRVCNKRNTQKTTTDTMGWLLNIIRISLHQYVVIQI